MNVGALNFRNPKSSLAWVVYNFKGESVLVDWPAVPPQVEAIKNAITEYDLDDVYNADESGLFPQRTSTYTLDTQSGLE
ncbi:hypothetical protein EDD11_006809 [Mortierella claussenii]|nr:hypothetical protein EDD11_006809 [Mortierella claussenii]